MSPIGWMAGLGIGSWLGVALLLRWRFEPELLLGMAGPLAAVTVSWAAMARVHAAAPERLTAVLTLGLGLKMVFFGVYVGVMVRGFDLRPAPFVAAFTSYFIALYAVEALFLKRLLQAPLSPGREGTLRP